jgi:hypothetical protein
MHHDEERISHVALGAQDFACGKRQRGHVGGETCERDAIETRG